MPISQSSHPLEQKILNLNHQAAITSSPLRPFRPLVRQQAGPLCRLATSQGVLRYLSACSEQARRTEPVNARLRTYRGSREIAERSNPLYYRRGIEL